jgi:NAD dependent epimerase/dehydratase family enzyme
MSADNSNLDKSYGGTSGDGSMIKSWISIKDIKKIVN